MQQNDLYQTPDSTLVKPLSKIDIYQKHYFNGLKFTLWLPLLTPILLACITLAEIAALGHKGLLSSLLIPVLAIAGYGIVIVLIPYIAWSIHALVTAKASNTLNTALKKMPLRVSLSNIPLLITIFTAVTFDDKNIAFNKALLITAGGGALITIITTIVAYLYLIPMLLLPRFYAHIKTRQL